MKNSFEKINYNLRPAKAVERKMIATSLQKLNRIDSLSNYEYVGFGSTFFKDHVIFHKELGIQKLTSIERSGKRERFEFNNPFHCIEITFGNSKDVLPKLKWNDRTILWLDYDKTLLPDSLADTRTFFRLAKSGSVFIISFNVNPDSYGEENKGRMKRIADRFGEERLPLNCKSIDFSGTNISKTLKKIVDVEIESILSERNGTLDPEKKLVYQQIYYFTYSDGAPMLTIGGIILNKQDKLRFTEVNFFDLPYIMEKEEAFHIEIPSLTNKEIKFLDSQLPSGIDENGEFKDELIKNPDIPLPDIVNYSKIYNFFPHFMESLHI